MRRARSVCLVILLAGWAAIGCVPHSKQPPPPPGPEPTTPATEDECRAVAVELEQAVQSGDPSRAIQAFDLEVVAHRVVAGLPVAEDQQAALLKLLPVRADANAIIDRAVSEVVCGGQFKLIRVGPADGTYKATFRVSNARFHVNYVEVSVARFADGPPRVAEVVWMEDGDRLTDLIRQEILPAAALRDTGLEARLGELDRLYLTNAKKVKELNQAFRGRRWREVVSLYMGLPTGLQEQKPLLFKYARACIEGNLGDATPVVAICRRRFAGDPAVDLLSVSYHYARRDYEAAVRTLDVLQDCYGEDALLDAARAFVLTKSGQHQAARAAAERAVAADRDLKLGYLVGILVAVAENDHAETLAWLKRAVEATEHDFGDLRQFPAYAEFIESPEFRQWLAWRATRQRG